MYYELSEEYSVTEYLLVFKSFCSLLARLLIVLKKFT